MTVLVQDLVTQTRVESGLRNNQLFNDPQIATFINDGHKNLYDKFVASLNHWFRKTAPFSLAGGEGNNTFDLTTIPDFQMDQGLNWNPTNNNNARPITVNRMGSFTNRNNVSYGFGTSWACELEYFTNGDTLFVNPAAASKGSYTLIYTPQATNLALPVPISVAPQTINIPVVPSHTGVGAGGISFIANDLNPASIFFSTDVGNTLTFAGTVSNNGTVTINAFIDANSVGFTPSGTSETFPSNATVTLVRSAHVIASSGTWLSSSFSTATQNVGDTLIVSGASNSGNNVSIPILSVGNGFVTTATTGLVNEFFASTVSITTQPVGSRPDVPQILTPWVNYLKTFASICINTSRQYIPLAELQNKLAQEEQRIVSMSKLRSEGVAQAPITRRRGLNGYGGFGFGV